MQGIGTGKIASSDNRSHWELNPMDTPKTGTRRSYSSTRTSGDERLDVGAERCLETASGGSSGVRGGRHPERMINSCARCSSPTPVHTSGANRYCPACLPTALANRPQVASVRKPTGSTRLTKAGIVIKTAFGWVPQARAVAENYLGRPLPPGHRVVQLQPHSEPCPANLAIKATGGLAIPLTEFARSSVSPL